MIEPMMKVSLVLLNKEKEEAVERAQSIFDIIHGALISSWIKQSNEDLLLVKNTLKYLIK